MKRFSILLLFALFSLPPLSPVLAQQQPAIQAESPKPAAPVLTVQQIKGNIYLFRGGAAANTGAIIAEKEVIVVDAKMTEPVAAQMAAEIRKLSPLPIGHIFITHSDDDHVNGLLGFPQGATIVSQENARADMVKQKLFQSARGLACLPGVTFSKGVTFYFGSDPGSTRVELLYFGPGHTNGDAIVYLPVEKVVFMGDLFFNTRDQLIHLHKNGGSLGLVKVLKAVLNLDAEVFLHGHGNPVTKADIRKHIQSIEDRQARVQALVKGGKTLGEVKKIYGIDDRPAQPGAMVFPSMVEVIYRELTEKK
jgi:cyclase